MSQLYVFINPPFAHLDAAYGGVVEAGTGNDLLGAGIVIFSYVKGRRH